MLHRERTSLISIFSLTLLVAVALTCTANAQSKCDAGKLKEHGKKISCLSKLDSKAAKKNQAVDAAKEQKCFDKFTEKCAKAEGQGDCTSAVKDCAALMTEAEVCRAEALLPLSPCAMAATDVRMLWSTCAVPDCFVSGPDIFLATPTVGPVVQEPHLVTDADGFGGSWPTSVSDQITNHYSVSEAATGYVMSRTAFWAPEGTGGSFIGQGSTGAVVPVLDEAWYISMYWSDPPAGGTRMIVRNPANGRAVVASAGYETGPIANGSIAGVTEEVHDYLGSAHQSDLEIGFAVDQALPLGPLTCP